MNKLIRWGKVLLIAVGFGLGSAALTNEFVTRPALNSYWTDCSNTVNDGAVQRVCAKKLVSTRGWPFPSVDVYSDGSTSTTRTDTAGYCIGGCNTTSIGGQFMYNALLLTILYIPFVVLAVRLRRKLMSKKL